MKNRVSLTLFLCAVLTLSAFAQQPSSNNGTPQATPRETATGKDPLPVNNKPENWWDGDDPGLAWLVLHPYASKKYVRRNTDAIRDRINELDQLTASNSAAVKDVDSRAQQGIQLASTRTKLADDHATDATTKAQQAFQSASTLNTRLATSEKSVGNMDQYKAANQTEIRFRPGQTVLSKQAKDALDQMAGQLTGQHGYIIEVQGFSSGRGQTAIANSRQLADAVVRYLMLSHDVPSYRIFKLGMGNTPVDNRAGSTRVQVSLLKNDVEVAKQ
jgi:outer membrane protein OmpA-like peptidoglycan-associated protein